MEDYQNRGKEAVGMAFRLHGVGVRDGLHRCQGTLSIEAVCKVHCLHEWTLVTDELKLPWADRMKVPLPEMKCTFEPEHTSNLHQLDGLTRLRVGEQFDEELAARNTYHALCFPKQSIAPSDSLCKVMLLLVL